MLRTCVCVCVFFFLYVGSATVPHPSPKKKVSIINQHVTNLKLAKSYTVTNGTTHNPTRHLVWGQCAFDGCSWIQSGQGMVPVDGILCQDFSLQTALSFLGFSPLLFLQLNQLK